MANLVPHRTRRLALAALLLLTLLALGLTARGQLQQWRRTDSLKQRLADRVSGGPATWTECTGVAASRPLVILALGQSNAGNHGEAGPQPQAPLTVLAQGRCHRSADPLPGATGRGGSLWSRLPPLLATQGLDRPLAVGLLSVESTTIDDWVRDASPLRAELARQVRLMAQAGLLPQLVLWQQGEADARAGTTADHYARGLQRLLDDLRALGVAAPVLAARSTVCNAPASQAIRQAQDRVAGADRQLRIGPDTDLLGQPQYRIGGCHWSALGLDAAAAQWASAIVAVPDVMATAVGTPTVPRTPGPVR